MLTLASALVAIVVGGTIAGQEVRVEVRVTQKHLEPLCLDGVAVAPGVRSWRLALGEHSFAFTMRSEPRSGVPDASPGVAVVSFTPEASHRYEVEVRAPATAFSSRVWVRGDWRPVVRDRTSDRIVSGDPDWGTNDCPARRMPVTGRAR